MKAEDINRAIAEACGWKLVPKDVPTEWPNTGEPPHWDSSRYHPIPNYCADLNAMAEAEQWLRNNQFHFVDYPHRLFEVIASPTKWTGDLGYFTFNFVTATAAQRAEAFLRTLGKWVETKGEGE